MSQLDERPPSPLVLVVDDNEANRALVRSTLEDEDYRVAMAASGSEGLTAFEQAQPDCVLLDVRMPDLSGIEVCARMRALSGGAEVPILFLTAQRDVDTFDRARQAGGDDFLTKPVSPAELVVRVQSALKLRRLGVELREHYAQLKEQRDTLLRLQLQKERLTAFVVHDLKNPVNSMDLNAQYLLRQKDLPPRSREAAARICSDAQQLNRMILNLLDIARAEESRLLPQLAHVPLRPLVDEVLAENNAVAQNRQVALRADLQAEQVYADLDLLRRTLTNLVENAVRHAPAASAVSVSAVRREAATELRVTDAGPGIPEDLREQIFDPFVQVASAEQGLNQRGRGLGLTFCKVVVVAHGGAIWVEDGRPGAVFCLRLPHGP